MQYDALFDQDLFDDGTDVEQRMKGLRRTRHDVMRLMVLSGSLWVNEEDIGL